MSRQLESDIRRRRQETESGVPFLHDWRELESKLGGLDYCGGEHCRREITAALEPFGISASVMDQLLQRITSLAASAASPGSLWQLFQTAVGMPAAPVERLAALSDWPWIAFGFHTALSSLLATGEMSRVDASDRDGGAAEFDCPRALAVDISEGKGHAIYNAHSYHTKVPHRAIMRYILHYTQPGDLVFDGFAGTGMTGVAAGLCGDAGELNALGLQVNPDGTLSAGKHHSEPPRDHLGRALRAGRRRAVLMDLSPAATLISAAYNSPQNPDNFDLAARGILDDLRQELGWMYVTLAEDADQGASESTRNRLAAQLDVCRSAEEARAAIETMRQRGIPLRTVRMTAWSDVVQCPNCQERFLFSDVAVDGKTGKVAHQLACPSCHDHLRKRDLLAVLDESGRAVDTIGGLCVRRPVCIHYEDTEGAATKIPDEFDHALYRLVSRLPLTDWYPRDRLFRGRETRRNDRRGITHVHHFYSPRNLRFLAALRGRCVNRCDLMLWFTSQLANLSYLNRYRPDVTFPYNPLSGTLYVGARVAESNPLIAYGHKVVRMGRAFRFTQHQHAVLCGSLATVPLPDASVDYVFTDPPFGANLAYSELNVLTEAWLGAFTRRAEEAIENPSQGKSAGDYAELLRHCFAQYFRVLKPGKWLTVEFHHTQPHTWEALQQALQRAGFVINDIRTLDKQLGSFKQVNHPGAVKQDLVVSAWKPTTPVAAQSLRPGTEAEVWEFVESRMREIGRHPDEAWAAEERQAQMMFNRTVAELLQRGATVPMTAADFYRQYTERFPEA